MKKTIIALILALVICAPFTLPVFAADGSSFETAIRLTPQPGDERRSPLEGYVPVAFTFERFDQNVYFVFTTANASHYVLHWSSGALRFDIYDSGRNLVHEDSGGLEAGARETYYVRVSFRGQERSFNRDAPINVEIGVLEYTPEWRMPGWILISVLVVYLVGLVFYRRYMLKNYDFNPLEIMPLLVSMGTAMVWMAAVLFLGFTGEPWALFLAMSPGFIMITLKLLSKTREPKIIAINTALMLGFYMIMAFVMVFVFLFVMLAAAAIVMFGAVGWVLRSGSGKKKCMHCGQVYSGNSCPRC